MGWFTGLLLGIVMTFVIIIILANVYPPPPPMCTTPSQSMNPSLVPPPSPSPGLKT